MSNGILEHFCKVNRESQQQQARTLLHSSFEFMILLHRCLACLNDVITLLLFLNILYPFKFVRSEKCYYGIQWSNKLYQYVRQLLLPTRCFRWSKFT